MLLEDQKSISTNTCASERSFFFQKVDMMAKVPKMKTSCIEHVEEFSLLNYPIRGRRIAFRRLFVPRSKNVMKYKKGMSSQNS